MFWDYENTALPPTALSAVYEYDFIKLSWKEPLIAVHWTLSHYQVYRDGDVIGEKVTEVYFEDDDFVAGEEYEYQVIVVYSDPAVESVPSNTASVNWNAVLPVTLSEFGVVSVDGGVRVYWTAETEVSMLGYRVLRADTGDVSVGVYVSALIDARNMPSAEHYFFIDREVVGGREYFYWLEAIELDGSVEVFGGVSVVYVFDVEESISLTSVSSVYPNPLGVGAFASFDISVKAGETAELCIYNVRGQLVRAFDGLSAGKQIIVWDGRDINGREVGSGVYFYRLSSGSSHVVQRMVVVK